ncbi:MULTISPECIES: nucleoside hydrolase [Paraliobacillus]|uniref:nucleoside hydrolase n=1 Tax=Paraliobacillus TaxID=200903 RepID=UPI000DD39555|nr:MULTISPECIES: nucleoside hydrolase [Paraliobacillus]
MKQVIIDTDTAGDDTIAILMALHHFQVEGVMITGGNVQFDQQVENALYTIEVSGKGGQVPVFKGHQGPILQLGKAQHRTVEDVHGSDGMGGANFPKARQKPETQHAVDFLIEKIHANPGEISLLAIAPLTNIAMALKKDPSIATEIKELFIMGGTNNYLGNITPAAEYNFYVDPEAARIVLHSGIPMTMVGWEMCTQYSIMNDADHLDIEGLRTKGSEFFISVNQVVKNFNRDVHRLEGTTHPDTLLVAIAAQKQIMREANTYYVDVETKGEFTRGYSVVDINSRLNKEPNVRVCEVVDRALFKESLLNCLKAIE